MAAVHPNPIRKLFMRSKILLFLLGLALALGTRAQAPLAQVSPALQGGMIVVSRTPPETQQPAPVLQRLVAPIAQKCAQWLPGWGDALGQVLMKLAWLGDLLLGTVGFWGLLGTMAGLCLAVHYLIQGMCRS